MPPHMRRARIFHTEFDRLQTRALKDRARAEGTSVHGILAAALIFAICADSGRNRGLIAFSSAVNLRNQLQPPEAEGVGMFVSLALSLHTWQPETDFWDLTRTIRQDVAQQSRTGFTLTAASILPLLHRLAGGIQKPATVMAENYITMNEGTAGLTNLGLLPVDIVAGPLTVETLQFVFAPSGLGDLGCSASTYNGALCFNMVWPEHCIDETHAWEIWRDLLAKLHQVTD